MIADDKRNLYGQFTGMEPAQQIIEAMVIFRNKNAHLGLYVVQVQAPLHPIRLGQRFFEITF